MTSDSKSKGFVLKNGQRLFLSRANTSKEKGKHPAQDESMEIGLTERGKRRRGSEFRGWNRKSDAGYRQRLARTLKTWSS